MGPGSSSPDPVYAEVTWVYTYTGDYVIMTSIIVILMPGDAIWSHINIVHHLLSS